MKQRYLRNAHGWQMTAAEVIERVFPGKGYGTRVPAEVSGAALIDGVDVYYMTTEDAKTHVNASRGMYMRAWAECPECGRMFSASRLNQHAKVHDT